MRVLMLGWEFPPFVAGGLGTACHGLTKAMARRGHEILFVLPKPIGGVQGDHLTLVGADYLETVIERTRAEPSAAPVWGDDPDAGIEPERARPARTTPAPGAGPAPSATLSTSLESVTSHPYPGVADFSLQRLFRVIEDSPSTPSSGLPAIPGETDGPAISGGTATALRSGTGTQLVGALERIRAEIDADHDGTSGHHYGSDLFGDARRYAMLVSAIASRERFDVIHAHDWLTYPAGLAAKALTGRPLVAHVHATEFDRSGEQINQGVYDLERAGMHGADRVITVSALTKSIAVNRYGADPARVDVVYNGVDRDGVQPGEGEKIEKDEKIVLFLGRITMQKGPEYFVRAAKRVLEKVEKVKFVVAGSGDMAVRMIEEAAALGIGHRVLFTGFLRGRDIDRVFKMADCFVMPSVSEPFGIAPLEAMSRDVPVIISKQSGVSEVLTHALKVDFWDTDEMANKIVAVLRYPPLSQTLREHGEFELRRLTWEGAAEKTERVFGRAISQA